MEIMLALEWRMSWHSGKERELSAPGKNMRLAQSLMAISNCRVLVIFHGVVWEGWSYDRDDVGRLNGEFMGQLFVEGNQVAYIYIKHVELH